MANVQHIRATVDLPAIQADVVTSLAPYRYGHFIFSPNGLTVEGKPKFEEWEEVGHMLAVQARGIQFMVGDWLNWGEANFGELAAQVIDARSWSPSTVAVYRHVAGKVPAECRFLDRGLDYAHHQAVAALAPKEQKKWLRQALGDGGAEEHWPVTRLKAAIKDGGDAPVSEWFLIVGCGSEARREELRRDLELKGYRCKDNERRG